MLKIKLIAGIVAILLPVAATSAEIMNPKDVAAGIWFRCEFSHSQIPPDDKCQMLDDDGFQIIKGVVHHVKILNSRETKCRHDRVGNCFKRTQQGLTAERSEIGPIKLAKKTVVVSWLGCAQNYRITKHPHYLEIAPALAQCWWTPDKRYFMRRYHGQITLKPAE